MQSNDTIMVNGLWGSGVTSKLPDGVVTRQKNKRGVNRYYKFYRNVNLDDVDSSNDDDEGLGLPEKHGQLRFAVMQIETNGKVGGVIECCFVIALLVGISYFEKTSFYTKLLLNKKSRI